MRSILFVIVLLVGGCAAKHSTINQLYPEYVGKFVRATQDLYLIRVNTDKQWGHPDYKISCDKPRYSFPGKIIEVNSGAKLYIDRFSQHVRFTESGTEIFGWVVIAGEKMHFYKILNTSYNGVKKEYDLPWVLADEI